MLTLTALLLLSPFLAQAADYKLVWSDEFNGNNLSICDWHFETGTGNGGKVA